MTSCPIGDFQSVPNRPNMQVRQLASTKHGIESFFIDEFIMEKGAAIPLHTHPIEEAIIVTHGLLTIQLGDEIVIAEPDSVVRIPPGTPHAIRNQTEAAAKVLAAAAGNRSSFFQEATTYLEGEPRLD